MEKDAWTEKGLNLMKTMDFKNSVIRCYER